MRPSFFHHLHPPTIPARQSRLRYTLGAGGLSVFLVLVLIVTGILEMFYYIPTPTEAPISVQQITFLVPYGFIIRNLHYWTAQILVLVAGLHLFRVIFTGAYAIPRRFNYLLGSMLFGMILLLDFSGYILRWDEGIHWALVVGTNLLATIPYFGSSVYTFIVGGTQIGSATLIRFYTWHIFGLTLILVAIGVWHIFRVRRDGGIAVPPPDLRRDPSRISRVVLVRRESIAAIISFSFLLLIAAFIPAPIAPPLDQVSQTAINVRAPWFLLWVQQLLRTGNPFLMGLLIPGSLMLFLALLPYILPTTRPQELGEWFPRGNRIAQIASAIIILVIVGLMLQALLFTE
jgi:quinol-cytochrome oxidoreductase complex cytochrome b subunit